MACDVRDHVANGYVLSVCTCVTNQPFLTLKLWNELLRFNVRRPTGLGLPKPWHEDLGKFSGVPAGSQVAPHDATCVAGERTKERPLDRRTANAATTAAGRANMRLHLWRKTMARSEHEDESKCKCKCQCKGKGKGKVTTTRHYTCRARSKQAKPEANRVLPEGRGRCGAPEPRWTGHPVIEKRKPTASSPIESAGGHNTPLAHCSWAPGLEAGHPVAEPTRLSY